MTEITAQTPIAQAVELALATGDLAKLSPEARVNYYNAVCKSMGLNPLTRPFEYLELNGKLTLYCRRDATDQLRKINNVSVNITKTERMDDVFVVTATARLNGREDTSTGAVALVKEDGSWETAQSGKRYFKPNGKYLPLRGDDLANALMKAETKAKRRVTLSIVGLGWLDETEIETIPDARPVASHSNPAPQSDVPVEATYTEAEAVKAAPLGHPEDGPSKGDMMTSLRTLAGEWYDKEPGIKLNNHLKRECGVHLGELSMAQLSEQIAVFQARLAERKQGVAA